MDVLQALSAARIVPVVVLDDAADADALAGALVAGGLPVAEVTFRTAAAADSIRAMAARGDILVGAGTVLTVAQVDQAVAAGARFVVSPGLSRAVVERCAEHGVLALPGAVTATEVQAALELGVSTVKFFPAGTCGGPAAIKALAGPVRRRPVRAYWRRRPQESRGVLGGSCGCRRGWFVDGAARPGQGGRLPGCPAADDRRRHHGEELTP